MGATTFFCSAKAGTSKEAYRSCVEDAQYEHGHDPYNGTISTTGGFIMIPLDEGESLEQWYDRVVEDGRLGKWGDCACCEKDGVFYFSGWGAE